MSAETRCTANYATIAVEPSFGPAQYQEVFARLQAGGDGKVLDLRCASAIGMDLFAALAAAWDAPADRVPRLAILLRYDCWALQEAIAPLLLMPVTQRGVAVAVCYAQQAEFLAAWFAGGPLRHNVPAAVAWLRAEWRATSLWPAILRTTAQLVQRLGAPDRVPVLLVDLAGIALSVGRDGAAEAAHYLGVALRSSSWEGEHESFHPARCRALRLLAMAAMYVGDLADALVSVEQAVVVAKIIKHPGETAAALAVSGCCLELVGQQPRAERQFRLALRYLAVEDNPGLRTMLNELLSNVQGARTDNQASLSGPRNEPGDGAQEAGQS